MRIDQLTQDLSPHVERMRAARASVTEPVPWYLYDILANLPHIDALLDGDHRDLDALSQGLPVADIGAADGDLAFTLEQALGWQMDIIDTAASNMNGLQGARLLKQALGSSAEIHDIDLDQQFRLPRDSYGLVLLLGILYHLQNPYYVLNELSKRTNYLLVSTRVARLAGPERSEVGDLPMAYLVGPRELNDDATNYWIFTPAGLERIADRTGWDIVSRYNVGETVRSVPDSLDGDERMFLLLRSRHRQGAIAATSATAATTTATDPAPGTPVTPPAPAAPPAAAATPGAEVQHCWPLGHHYSPVPDTRVLSTEPTSSRVWPAVPRPTPGIDWRDEQQVALVRELGRQAEMVFPTASTGDISEYHTGPENEMFSRLDAWTLQAMLRHYEPSRVIEVGCGWSSLVTARAIREHLGGDTDFTCIEPYPPAFLEGGVPGIDRLIPSPVQDVDVSTFEELRSGDVLFIDTAHVIKTGGDVQYLYHEVVPRLAPGVLVHVHDIFLPRDYPADWVLSGRGWNEQYLLQSFLAFNSAFEIRLGIGWMHYHHPDVLAEAVPGYPERNPDGGGSFWMQRSEG